MSFIHLPIGSYDNPLIVQHTPLLDLSNIAANLPSSASSDVRFTGSLCDSIKNDAFNKYTNIALKLLNHEKVVNVANLLADISTRDLTNGALFHTAPFFFFESSSGSGKSQMAFNIIEHFRGSRNTFYFLYSRVVANSQRIYQNFTSISELFQLCLKGDSEFYSCEYSPSSEKLYNKHLFVYGFIYALIENGIENSVEVQIEKKTGAEITQLIQNKDLVSKRPIFIMDECVGDSLKMLRFSRNCFSSLGLVLIMLGTDSRACQVASGNGSSRECDKKEWCYIIGDYPPFDLKVFDTPPKLPVWLEYILLHSRPLFASLVLEEYIAQAQNEVNFDDIILNAFNSLINVKNIFATGNQYGNLGQIRLFNNAHCKIDDSFASQKSAFIQSHFAQLNNYPENFQILSNGFRETGKGVFQFLSSFPALKDDILLYLILMGGKGFPAFRHYNEATSYSVFLNRHLNTTDIARNKVFFSNASQSSNDGQFLESLLCSVICLSSHSNGFAGIQIQNFVNHIVFNVQIVTENFNSVFIKNIGNLGNLVIPYLLPPNQDIDLNCFRIPDSYIALMKRDVNSAMRDLSFGLGCYAESKDHAQNLNSGTIASIIKKIPVESKLFIVFTRGLCKTYANKFKVEEKKKLSFEEAFPDIFKLGRSYYKIDASFKNSLNSFDTVTTSLELITGLNDGRKDGAGIVLFILIDKKINIDMKIE